MERVLRAYVQLVYAFMYLPVAVVALFSFNSAEMMAFPMTGFTLGWYDVAVHDHRLLGRRVRSLRGRWRALPRGDDEPPGRNESKRECGLEKASPEGRAHDWRAKAAWGAEI